MCRTMSVRADSEGVFPVRPARRATWRMIAWLCTTFMPSIMSTGTCARRSVGRGFNVSAFLASAGNSLCGSVGTSSTCGASCLPEEQLVVALELLEVSGGLEAAAAPKVPKLRFCCRKHPPALLGAAPACIGYGRECGNPSEYAWIHELER